MTEFPRLKTGAVAQYPLARIKKYSTEIFRFLDGSEQRCRDYSAPLRRWLIHLDQLDEQEMAQIEEFFRAQQGQAGTFSFVDPWTGQEYPACALEDSNLILRYTGPNQGEATIVIREERT
jgi:hypothetical protein